MEMICKGSINPAKMPPSPRAAHFHGLRAHFQIITWKLLDDDPVQIKPEGWGRRLNNGDYEPVTTDEVVVPETLLQSVRYKCQSKKNQCATNRCSCRKHCLKCTATCGNCQGEDCETHRCRNNTCLAISF